MRVHCSTPLATTPLCNCSRLIIASHTASPRMPDHSALHACVKWDKMARWVPSKGHLPPLTLALAVALTLTQRAWRLLDEAQLGPGQG